MTLRIYNTLSGQKEDFNPITPGEVKMYVCGVTVYDSSHIGHAMSAISFDIIKRYLEYRGYKVHHVINFTDIEDKIIKRANAEGVTWQVITNRYIDEYLEWMDALNVKRATVYPRATDELPNIISAIGQLIAKGFAYEANGDVYYRVLSKPQYGELKHQNLDELRAGARVELGDQKESDLDFALWKTAKPGEPSWESPWGQGRPGWHIECSAMALHHLGAQLDIHGGGSDLIFPHHENEIAQSEALTGKRPFSRYWAHNGMLQARTLDESSGKWLVEKMSKSLGNSLTVGNLLAMGDPDMLRMFVMGSHYRSPLTYTGESFEIAFKNLKNFKQIFAPEENWGDPTSPEGNATASQALLDTTASVLQRFEAAMDDDFNTPRALDPLFELKSEIFKARSEEATGLALAQARQTLAQLGSVLGLRLTELPDHKSNNEVEPYINLLVQIRQDLKKARQFALADQVRDELKKLGVKLEDRPDGTIWKFDAQ